MSKGKASNKRADQPEKKEIALPEKKEVSSLRRRRAVAALAPYRPSGLWRDFDRIFDRFRSDFEELLWPSETPLARAFSMMPSMETRVPYVDLEDRGKDFLLTAEMPGFKKEDVDIQVSDDVVEIKAVVGWKYDDKTKKYICRERACETFYRMIELPEEVKADAVQANMKDGVIEVVLPKKTPKQKKKVSIK